MTRHWLAMAVAIGALASCTAAARSPDVTTPALVLHETPVAETAMDAPLAAPVVTPVHVSNVGGVERRVAIAQNAIVSCHIDADETAHGVAISARARANDDVSGDYDLVITKRGAAGSSDVRQGGAFDLASGQADVLSASEISLERNGRFRAVLTLSDESGEICRDEIRS